MPKLTHLKSQNLFGDGSIEIFDAATGKWIANLKKGEGIAQTLFDLPKPVKNDDANIEHPQTINDPNQISLF